MNIARRSSGAPNQTRPAIVASPPIQSEAARVVPGLVTEIPGQLDVARRRALDEREQPVVAHRLDDDPDRAEPVAERQHALEERGHAVEARERELDGELEPVGRRLGPAPELILAREPVAGRVQLDRVEVPRVEAEELGGLQPLRVEARPPGGVRPTRGADPDHASAKLAQAAGLGHR